MQEPTSLDFTLKPQHYYHIVVAVYDNKLHAKQVHTTLIFLIKSIVNGNKHSFSKEFFWLPGLDEEVLSEGISFIRFPLNIKGTSTPLCSNFVM